MSKSSCLRILFVLIAMGGVVITCGCSSSPVNDQGSNFRLEAAASEIPPPEEDPYDPLLSTQLECGYLEILAHTAVPDSNLLRFELNVYYGQSGPQGTASERFLDIKSFDTTAEDGGYLATLTTSVGGFLWQFEHRREAYGSGHFWTVERSHLDELQIEHVSTDSSITELFTQNGVVDTFEFTTGNEEYIQAIHDSLLTGELSRQVNKSDGVSLQEATILTLNDFDEYFDTTSSLIDNPEGELVAQFLTSEEIADWLILEYPDTSSGQPVYLIPDEVCAVAIECSVVACSLQVHPVCEVCVAVAVACVIERIVDYFF